MRAKLRLCLLLVPALALGGENRWQGGGKKPSDWHDAGNWSLGAVPRSDDGNDVAIASGTVRVRGDAAVAGALVLSGGHLVVEREKVLAVGGDLVFRGSRPAASLTPHGEVRVRGTIASEGSARYGATATGWVVMVGEGDQVVTPGGFLPPIRIAKASGKVTLAGDLHCAGLHVAPGNTLDLTGGQRLLLGTPLREWRFDPKDRMIVKTYHPFRSSRDLINQGTILGKPSVPFTLFVNADDEVFAVSGRYEGPRKASESPVAGGLSINAPASRLSLEKGTLLLDGKPPAAEAPLDDGAGDRARITGLSLRKVPPKKVDTAGLHNVAPAAAALRSEPSIGHRIWRLVDGSEATGASFRSGVGRGGRIELVLAEPATVSAVRFRQGRLFAIRYEVRGDRDGDGECETELVAAAGGSPNAWREHAFAPTRVHRIAFHATEGQRGWERSYPDLQELEVYADAPPPERAEEPQQAPERRLSLGPQVDFRGPAVRPEDRILQGVMIDVWMFGIHDERQLTFGHLRDYEPFKKLLAGMKDLGADTALLFIEAEPLVFWPSRNFKSLTNRAYFKELERRKLREAEKDAADGAGDAELELEGEKKEERPKEPPKLPVIDPPVKTDILREFCEGMHENGIKVLILFHAKVGGSYVGPPDRDAWTVLFEEAAARGVDGIYVLWDEAWFGLANPKAATLPPDHPDRIAFRKRWGPDADLPTKWEQTVDYKRHVLMNYERLAQWVRRRCDAIRAVNPKCLTLTNIGSHSITSNNRMTYGTAYDVLGHLGGLDYLGSDYVHDETRTFVGSAKNRQATMVLGAGEHIGTAVSCIFQGARAINYYRYNYIELWKATERRRRGFQLIRTLERWGIGAARTPKKIALVVSRASEDWWDNAHGTYWLGGSAEGKQGFWTSRLVNELLLRAGYPFDLYYMDQAESLRAVAEYTLVIVPFPYSVSRAAAEVLRKAHAAGAKLLIAQRRGEVDELGRKHPKPILDDLIERGRKDGSVVYLDRDLVAAEVERSFDAEMSGVIDGLLGPEKPLSLWRHGHRVEAHLAERREGARLLALINWGEAAEVEVGVSLPAGSYRVLAVSSRAPRDERVVQIGGKEVFAASDLAHVGVKLAKDEVVVLRITPTGAR